ncbi:MAG: acetyl-CoA carboxylase biotin carboxyl carrier protein [Bacteroidota bacterium]
MDLNYLKKLVKIFDESTVTELSIEEEGTKLKLSKRETKGRTQTAFMPMTQAMPQQSQPELPQPAAAAQSDAAPADTAPEVEGHVIKSPIVGTFYSAPSPESDPFVEIGSRVSPGQVLCIIEAMKLMNEIESDVAGTVVKILIDNAQPVEYNQPIFIIKPE